MLSALFWSKQPPFATESATGAQGERVTLSAICIAHTTLTHIVATEPAKGYGFLASETIGGVIGGPILNHYVVVYDLPTSQSG